MTELPELWQNSENLADLPTENVPGHLNHMERSMPGIQSILTK